jgi:pimeloyl-ACP methyl ester carboxylesterase
VAIPGLILVDLMWHRRNQVMAARLARKLLALRRAHPNATIHLVAFSGGTGIAVFALERLRGRVPIETLILACPAISREYNLGPALRGVQRCYALVSCRDRWLLGVGTRLFGTMDRRYERSAGLVGFARPEGLTAMDAEAYSRIREIHWSPELRRDGHAGGHTGWVHVPFLRRHLPALLAGKPLLPTRTLDSAQ